jgi:molecular chaperone DnaJ
MSSSKRDYYEVLGVAREASGEDIKRAYRRLAMKYHPDRADGNKQEAETKFKECAEAYEVLSDENSRRRYDQYGHAGVQGQHDFSHMDPGDIFSMFNDIFGEAFGGGFARGRGGARRGYDLEMQVEISLAEVARGTEKTLEFERQDTCSKCNGSGAKPGTVPARCPQCAGQGRVMQQGFGGMFRMVTTCPNCSGSGKIIREHCPQCAGGGRQMRKHTVSVKIPPGIHEGQALRLVGEGEAGQAGAPRGDLHVYIAIKQHPIFTRHNNDLVCQLPVSFTQAAMGAMLQVPTLDGSAELEVPAGSQHGEVFKLKGKGLPDLRSHRVGDELVQILLEVPKKLTEKQKQLLREFAGTEDVEVMPQRKGFMEKLKEAIKGH